MDDVVLTDQKLDRDLKKDPIKQIQKDNSDYYYRIDSDQNNILH